MTKAERDPFADQLSLPPEFLPTYAQPYVPPARRRRHQQFAQFPMWWFEKLLGANGSTCRLAIYIVHRLWKNKRKPFKLPNMALGLEGISRSTKWRALTDLEHRGLVKAERCRGKSPIIHPILTR